MRFDEPMVGSHFKFEENQRQFLVPDKPEMSPIIYSTSVLGPRFAAAFGSLGLQVVGAQSF